MKILEVNIIFESENIEKYKKMISDILYEFGVNGLKFEEPLTNKNPLDFYHDEKQFLMVDYSISAYFPLNIYSDKRKELIIKRFSDVFSKTDDLIYLIDFYEHDDEDYKNNWKNYFFTQKISDKFVVKPTWRDYTPEQSEIVIELDPGMAFGTGTHPTTSLCLQLLESTIKEGDTVIDIGTGSGILMIAADKLNASQIYGIDIDELAIDVSKENLLLNNVDLKKFFLSKTVLSNFQTDIKFDLVVANILADVLEELLPDIKNILKPSGKVIFSGIIDEKYSSLINKIEKYNFNILKRLKDKDWNSILFCYNE